MGQKLLENAKIEKFKCDILGDFQTLLKQQRSLDIFFRNQIMQFLSAAVSRLGHVATVATPHPTGKVFSSPAFRPHDDGDQSHPLTAMYGNVAAFVQG